MRNTILFPHNSDNSECWQSISSSILNIFQFEQVSSDRPIPRRICSNGTQAIFTFQLLKNSCFQLNENAIKLWYQTKHRVYQVCLTRPRTKHKRWWVNWKITLPYFLSLSRSLSLITSSFTALYLNFSHTHWRARHICKMQWNLHCKMASHSNHDGIFNTFSCSFSSLSFKIAVLLFLFVMCLYWIHIGFECCIQHKSFSLWCDFNFWMKGETNEIEREKTT